MIRRRQLAAVLLMLTMTVGAPVNAQEAEPPTVDFVVTPSRLEVRVGPDEAIEFPIQVINRSETQLRLLTYVEDIEIPDSDLVTNEELAFTASRWTTFQQDEITVPGGGSMTVNVRVAIPASTPPGGYHAFAFFQTEPDPSDVGVVPSGRIGVTLLVDVTPEEGVLRREARVDATSIDVSWDSFFSPQVVVSTTVQNLGEAHVMVGGLHTYRSWPTGGVNEVKIGPSTLFRGTQTTLSSESDALPLFGKVTVTSELVYQVGPDNLPVILTQATAWIIPWRLIFTLALLIGGTSVLARRRKKSTTNELNDLEST